MVFGFELEYRISVLPLLFDRWWVNLNFSGFLMGEGYFYSRVNKFDIEF